LLPEANDLSLFSIDEFRKSHSGVGPFLIGLALLVRGTDG
jgi:hypothetical protein